jgi:tetratricopeptide (TPR) repeat protein
MTALSLSRLRLARLPHVRPLGIFAASVALVVGQLASVNRDPEAAAPVGAGPGVPAGAGPAAPRTVEGPISPPDAPLADTPASVVQIDSSIARWSANLAANDLDFISARNVALLYEGRARISGDVTDYDRAEEAASRSLGIEPRQLDVQALHARILLATHEFSRALAEASAVDRSAPNQPAVLAIMGDASLELGDVEAAAALYDRIEALAPGPAVTVRQARIAFVRGDVSRATALAGSAYEAAVDEGQTGPSLSWYAFLAGTLTIDGGDPEGARAWFDLALDAWPGSFQALAGQARVSAALGDTDGAIAAYQAANAIAPQPAALRHLGDLLLLRGDDVEATAAHERFLQIVRPGGQPNALYAEELVAFLADHGTDVGQALELAEQNLAATQDAHAYDAYAWALFANDRVAEARAAVETALELSGQDATILYHAGMITLAIGDTDAGRGYLDAALGIRGGLDPLATSRAAAALAGLQAR